MKKALIILLLAVLLFNQGCCSIFTSGPEKVSIDSTHKGAKVKMGPYKGVTPYEVWLPRGKNYVVEVSYGDKTDSQPLEKHIQGLYWVNILFWPGLIIDLATGDMYKYEPANYDFTL